MANLEMYRYLRVCLGRTHSDTRLHLTMEMIRASSLITAHEAYCLSHVLIKSPGKDACHPMGLLTNGNSKVLTATILAINGQAGNLGLEVMDMVLWST